MHFVRDTVGIWIPDYLVSSCYETIMFGRVTHARRRYKARALSVYLTHILSQQQQLHIEIEREYNT